jgi:hypothetical protein
MTVDRNVIAAMYDNLSSRIKGRVKQASDTIVKANEKRGKVIAVLPHRKAP